MPPFDFVEFGASTLDYLVTHPLVWLLLVVAACGWVLGAETRHQRRVASAARKRAYLQAQRELREKAS